MVLKRVFTPPPQISLQVFHSDQADNLQSALSQLRALISPKSEGQGFPPLIG